MPELPDVVVYLEALERRILGKPLEKVRVQSPFVLRTVEPPLTSVLGRPVTRLSRLGKRLVWEFEGDFYLVIHLMVEGRLRWKARGAKPPGRIGLAAFDFPDGTLLFTEAGSKRRASVHVVAGRAALAESDRGGLEALGSDVQLTSRMPADAIARLHAAVVAVLVKWTDRLRAETGDAFPEKVTAFHEGMAVHGRYREPCPVCGTPVQRIRYADNETNYCPTCQTGGRLLADRAMSRLLRQDWPRSLDEMEERLTR